MKITRIINNKTVEIELTADEISLAHTEHIKNFMQSELENSFGYDTQTAEELAELAYDEYAEGNGLTEYECIEKIAEEYENEHSDV